MQYGIKPPYWNFNPRSPCGERLRAVYLQDLEEQNFNPRSPCGERRQDLYPKAKRQKFQSTLPVRGATARACPVLRPNRDFNPRSPCGERLIRGPF